MIEKSGSRLSVIHHGLIKTPKVALPERLSQIHREMLELLDTYRPDAVATERLLFTVNKTTAMDVAKALGVILLTCSERRP